MKLSESKSLLAPCQLTMALDSAKLQGLSASERSAAVALLAELLLEAGGMMERENDDDRV